MKFDDLSDDVKAGLFISALVLIGGLFFGGAAIGYHIFDKREVAELHAIEIGNARADLQVSRNDFIKLREEKNKALAERDRYIGQLTGIIEQRLPLLVDQASESVEKLDKLSDQVDNAVTQSKRAATTANRAAVQAGQAVKKSKQPAGAIRQVPTRRVQKHKCYGKDVFGDLC
jgi:ElaB/YqjD/DUF883 family membrane-anchored ribosome-binding protein